MVSTFSWPRGRHHTYVIGIGEEAGAGHDDGANMIPSERRLVDFSKQQSATFVGIEDMVIDIEHVSVGRTSRVALEGRHGECRVVKKAVSSLYSECEEHSQKEQWMGGGRGPGWLK